MVSFLRAKFKPLLIYRLPTTMCKQSNASPKKKFLIMKIAIFITFFQLEYIRFDTYVLNINSIQTYKSMGQLKTKLVNFGCLSNRLMYI